VREGSNCAEVSVNDVNNAIVRVAKTVVPEAWRRRLREHLLPWRVKHLFGRRQIALAEDEAAVACVVKNGEYYLDSFVEHYTAMGFQHIFFLDNGSTDNTVQLAEQYDHVTVYQSDLPIECNQAIFKKCLAETAVPSGWCLDADIDEFFDYPFSDTVSLAQFLAYLNQRRYSAVLTQMLDMFSDRPLAALAQGALKENLKQVYRYYDLSQVTMLEYQSAELTRRFAYLNQLAEKKAQLCFGGIRKSLSGINCLLSKHSLFRTGNGLDLFTHVHFVNRARLADVSCLLLHYKLVGNAYKIASQNRKAFPSTSKGYEDLIHVIEGQPDYRLKGDTAVEFGAVSDLFDGNFLFASQDYRIYARASTMKGAI
jgi:Glycosyl transferase family 2